LARVGSRLAKGKTHTGRIWTYVRNDRPFGGQSPPAALYYASRDRRQEHPERHLKTFEELCAQFPGRFTRKQYKTFARKVSLWRQAANARGVVIGSKTYRRVSNNPRGRRPDIFKVHWDEMAVYLEEHPDQTALELLVEFQARYPGQYSSSHLRKLQKRVRAWRQQAIQRLIGNAGTPVRIGQGSAVTA
jgi:K+-sensing histidine kinase KdpD